MQSMPKHRLARGTKPGFKASPPTQLAVKHEVKLGVSAEAAWSKVGRFDRFTWVPAVRGSSADTGNEIGSVRIVELESGTLTEQLIEYDPETLRYRYVIQNTLDNQQVLPVSNLEAIISVRKLALDSCLVVWSATFLRLDKSPSPSSGVDDVAAYALVNETVSTALRALADQF